MRPVFAVGVAVFVAVQTLPGAAEEIEIQNHPIDLNPAATFDPHVSSQTGPLFHSLPALPSGQINLLPSVTFGPFHASLGGVGGTKAHLGTYELDTGSFLGSHLSGSIGTRSARLVFSVPTS